MLGRLKRFIKAHFVVTKVTPVEIPVYRNDLLQGKTALIIGGSGGIGSEIAKAYANSGCLVALVGTKEDKLKKICQEIGTSKAQYIIANLKSVNEIQKAIHDAVNLLGKIDILVHCAGVHCQDKFGNISEQTWDDVIDVNLKSMYFACQHISNYMIAHNIKGHILNVGSASAAKPGWTPYEISKNGVRALTLGFADKLAPYGIVVNSIAPGPVATPMLGKHDSNDIAWSGNPTGRMSTPAEIANWAVFMVSDMGNMVVGDTFFVSGGSGTICLDK